MKRLNRDSIIAIALLLFCGVFFWASFDIRTPNYGVLKPSTWPRVIIGIMSFLSLIYLIQSLKGNPNIATAGKSDREPGFRGWVDSWPSHFGATLKPKRWKSPTVNRGSGGGSNTGVTRFGVSRCFLFTWRYCRS